MKPIVINHELREIHLQYNSDQPLGEFETTAVLAYIELHHSLEKLHKRHNRMNGVLFKLEIDLSDLEQEINELAEEVKRCGPLAGYTNEECEKFGLTEGKIEVNPLIEKATLHQKKMDLCFEQTHQIRDEIKIWKKDEENLKEEVEKFNQTYFSPIIQNYKEMEIDSCSLDEDIQGFYQIYDELSMKLNRQFVKTWNAYVLRFNVYLEKVKELFARVEKLSQTANHLVIQKKIGGFGLN